MKTLFVMDPLDRIHVAGDSTYVLMREHCDRGLPIWYCTPDDLYAQNGWAGARATRLTVTDQAPHFFLQGRETLPLSHFDVVWQRKDPPFHMGYIFTTYLLEMVPRTTLVLNHPAGLQRYNEKLWAMQFRDLHPPTLVSSDKAQIRAFVEALPGKAVLKPWDGNGGRGVVVTERGDRNLASLIELLTEEGRVALIAQAYLDAIATGDKRILLFDGEPVGAMLRVPSGSDHRGNMHVGARVEACELTERDVEICRVLGPHLKRHGMMFVGIDVIGDYLTEINVTSPTGIQEINRLYGLALEADLVDRVQRLIADRAEAP